MVKLSEKQWKITFLSMALFNIILLSLLISLWVYHSKNCDKKDD